MLVQCLPKSIVVLKTEGPAELQLDVFKHNLVLIHEGI